jgi:hypothetical protein
MEQMLLDAAALAKLRPRCRMGTYVFGERGYTINPELPGEDRPEQVAALSRDAFHWAGLDQGTEGVEKCEANALPPMCFCTIPFIRGGGYLDVELMDVLPLRIG